MRKRELERSLAGWQDLLRLRDWEIELEHREDPDMPSAVGTCDYDALEKTATIFVRPGTSNQELTLVHELIHLWISPLVALDTKEWAARPVSETVLEEQVCEAFSKALLALKYRKDGE